MKSVSLGLVIAAVSLMVVIGFSDLVVRPAFAVGIETINPTGDALLGTADCWQMASSATTIFMGCNTTLLAYSTSNVHIANVTVASLSSDDLMVPLYGSNGVIIFDISGVIARKYILSGSTLSLSGSFDPVNCADTGSALSYDDNGWLWITCVTADTIQRFNPGSMTVGTTSPDLTDAVGIDCDAPIFVDYSAVDNIGVIGCGTSNTYATFSQTAPITVSLLDSEPEIGSDDAVWIDGGNNRFFVAAAGIRTFPYSAAGVISPVLAAIGSAGGYGSCMDKAVFDVGVLAVCANIDIADVFISDGSSMRHAANLIPATVGDIDPVVGISWREGTDDWYISGGDNNDHYLKVTDITFSSDDPVPPGGGGTTGPGAGGCNADEYAIDFSEDGSNIICVPLNAEGTGPDCSGFACNPLLTDSTPGIGIPSMIAIWGFTEDQANILATIGLFMLTGVFVIVPAWRFGYDPSPMMIFVLIMLNLALATTLGWIDSLYFFAVIAAIAVGGGLKFSGVL